MIRSDKRSSWSRLARVVLAASIVAAMVLVLSAARADGQAGCVLVEPVDGLPVLPVEVEDECPDADPAPVVSCRQGFAWGGECWRRGEGQRFAGWLRDHGASPATFARRHPEIAATFGPGWPVPPLRACRSASCVPAVVRAIFPAATEEHALAIVRCETGGTMDPRAVGDGGYSRGIWQINYVHWRAYGGWVDETRLFEPWYATRVAHRMSGAGRDFSAWTCERYV